MTLTLSFDLDLEKWPWPWKKVIGLKIVEFNYESLFLKRQVTLTFFDDLDLEQWPLSMLMAVQCSLIHLMDEIFCWDVVFFNSDICTNSRDLDLLNHAWYDWMTSNDSSDMFWTNVHIIHSQLTWNGCMVDKWHHMCNSWPWANNVTLTSKMHIR